MKKISKYDKKGFIFASKSLVCSMLAFSTFAIMAKSCSDEQVIEYNSVNTTYEISTETNNNTTPLIENNTNSTGDITTNETDIIETTDYNSIIENELDITNVNVIEYDVPIEFDNNIMESFVNNCVYTPEFSALDYICFGYDNLALRNSLQEHALSLGYDNVENLTVDNFRYFLYYESGLYSTNNAAFNSSLSDRPFYWQVSRAVCSENNLRFMVDEIPSSYFYERFPEFMRMIDNGQLVELCDLKWDLRQVFTLPATEPVELDIYQRDFCEFVSCAMYNYYRYSFIYNYGAETFDRDYQNDVRQVRDQRNNRHVLVPTEEQYNEIMENLHEVPTFENIDIYQVETREEYFNAYGVYPEDVLSQERYDLNYEPYVSPYEFDVVQIDQNMNSNQGRSRTPN